MTNNNTLSLTLSLLITTSALASGLVLPPPPSEVEANMKGISTPDTVNISAVSDSSTIIAPPPPSETEGSALTSKVKVAYASLYSEQGLTPTSLLTSGGSYTFAYEGTWYTSHGLNLVGQLNYTSLVEKNIHELKNPINFSIGLHQELFPNLFNSISYIAHFDGLRGLYARDGFVAEMNVAFRYEFVPSGYFLEMDYTPALAGISGFSTSFSGGHKFEFSESLALITSVKSIFSWGYWDKDGLNSVSLNLALPYTTESSGFTITPFVSCEWLGNTGLEINRKNHAHVFKPFAFTTGARIEYTF